MTSLGVMPLNATGLTERLDGVLLADVSMSGCQRRTSLGVSAGFHRVAIDPASLVTICHQIVTLVVKATDSDLTCR
jgi:hypothetical protein